MSHKNNPANFLGSGLENRTIPSDSIENFISLDRFQIIFSAIAEVSKSKDERLLLEQKVNDLQQRTFCLNLMLVDAQDFSAGSKKAGTRLINLLNSLLYSPVVLRQNIGVPVLPNPTPLPNPIPPPIRFPGNIPCLFDPNRFIDILFAIERLKLINPQEFEIFGMVQTRVTKKTALAI